MKISPKGLKQNGWHRSIDYIIHKGRCMTDYEARTLVNYAIAHDLDDLDDVPEEVIDAICEVGNNTYAQYEDTDTRFISAQQVRYYLERYFGRVIDDTVIEEIMDYIE